MAIWMFMQIYFTSKISCNVTYSLIWWTGKQPQTSTERIQFFETKSSHYVHLAHTVKKEIQILRIRLLFTVGDRKSAVLVRYGRIYHVIQYGIKVNTPYTTVSVSLYDHVTHGRVNNRMASVTVLLHIHILYISVKLYFRFMLIRFVLVNRYKQSYLYSLQNAQLRPFT